MNDGRITQFEKGEYGPDIAARKDGAKKWTRINMKKII